MMLRPAQCVCECCPPAPHVRCQSHHHTEPVHSSSKLPSAQYECHRKAECHVLSMANARFNHNYNILHNNNINSYGGHISRSSRQSGSGQQDKERDGGVQLVNVNYENEKKPHFSNHKNSLSRRYSMIEDTDYNYNSPKTVSGNYNNSKPTMQTSRLSVFLQQNKDPTHSAYSKPSNYGFSNVYSHESPVIRRTPNDDE